MNKKSFTLIELIVVIAVIGILAIFVIVNLSGIRSVVYDAVRKNDISNIYKSIAGKKAVAELGEYYEGTAAIKQGETPADLQSFIDQFLKTTPYDPNPSKAYLYTSNGKDFSLAAILDDGTCFIKSTGIDLFGSDVCDIYMQGGLGLVSDFMILHGSLIDITWSIPEEFADSPEGDISTAIVCVSSATELTDSQLPSDSELIANGIIVGIANNKTTIYRVTPDNPSYYYYCKAITYDETIVSNPGGVGSTPNTGSGGFLPGTSTNGDDPAYSVSDPTVLTPPEVLAGPVNIGGGGSSGEGTTSSSFVISDPVRLPDGKGSLTLRWKPALGSTATHIRRIDNIPPATEAPKLLIDGTQVTIAPNKVDITEWHTYTDDNNGAGLDELHIYCYSAWGYDSSSTTYSPGFVLACGAVPAADPVSFDLVSQSQYIDLSWVKGGNYRTLIRRQINTAPKTINEGVLIYNGTDSTYRDLDDDSTPLSENTSYCYSIWHVNSATGAISNNHIEKCSQLLEVGDVTGLQSSSITATSIKLTWTKASASTHTIIRRSQGATAPTDMTQGAQVYNSTE
ncbi:MAG: type II secretion system protein [Candidatus Pacebacteria bacterium]|nr:type II secretion system protein [Candidatus Paceibacterota bacterium]